MTSSLSILHSAEQVYHSLDEEIEADFTNNSSKYYYKKSEYQKIIGQKHMEINPDEKDIVFLNSNETIPDSVTFRNSLNMNFRTNIYNI